MKTNKQSHMSLQLPTANTQQPPGRKHLIMKKAKSLLAKLLIICLLAPLAPSVNKPHLTTQASTAYPPSAWGSVTDFPDADAYGGLLSLYTLS
ncbi:MAG: hypothetical protein FWE82_06090, partial [Defluviitaleaceae bacterium]|nr:hypothetical protein [Defluviitaleaceae bacterium]